MRAELSTNVKKTLQMACKSFWGIYDIHLRRRRYSKLCNEGKEDHTYEEEQLTEKCAERTTKGKGTIKTLDTHDES